MAHYQQCFMCREWSFNVEGRFGPKPHTPLCMVCWSEVLDQAGETFKGATDFLESEEAAEMYADGRLDGQGRPVIHRFKVRIEDFPIHPTLPWEEGDA